MSRRERFGHRRGARLLILAGLGAGLIGGLLPGCGDPPPPVVEPARALPAEPGYVDEIAQIRARKDKMFQNDPVSPLSDSRKVLFQGLEYFPVDQKYQLTGRIAIYPRPKKLTIPGSRGEMRVAERYAAFPFVLDGRTHTLQVYRLFEPGRPEGQLFMAFSDETTGRETYPAGRYIDPLPGPDGTLIVDFNLAYNPWCAYGKEYDCPLTPAENRLDVPIPAGERGRNR